MKNISIVFILIVSIIVVSNIFCNDKNEPQQQTFYLNLQDTVKYVGMEACRQCHVDKYETFIHTGMGQSFDKATQEKSAGNFSKHTTVYDKYSGFYYTPFWQDSNMMVMEYRLASKDTVYKRIEKIDFIVGSGQHTNSHIANTNGYLHQIPITYYTQTGKWDLPPGYENGYNSRFSRTIGIECMSCHNSYPEFVNGSENKFTRIPDGINCERCHGPGEIHVKEKLSGKIINTTENIDYTIVNPAKLTIELQIDVCQRCHLQGNSVLKDGRSFLDFKPGMKLSSVFDVFLPKFKGDNNDFIMASHADRMKMSRCFTESIKKSETRNNKDKTLTCITCHNPHKSVKITGNEIFNSACSHCHNNNSSVSTLTCSADIKQRESKKDNCIKCHMIKSGTTDIPHVITTDHYIRKPVDSLKVNQIKEFAGLMCLTDDSPSPITFAKAYLNYYEKFSSNPAMLDSAAFYLLKENNKQKISDEMFNTIIHLLYLKNNFDGVINYVNQHQSQLLKDSWTNYRIGEAYYQKGKMQDAYNYFNNAVTQSPYNLEFLNKSGSTLMNLGKTDEAKMIFNRILFENPKHIQALNNLGYVYFTRNNLIEAEKFYEKALTLDPDYESAIYNKVNLYFHNNDIKKAIVLLEGILKTNPDNEKAKQTLSAIREQ